MFAAAYNDPAALWSFVELLMTVLGLIVPLIALGWWAYSYFHKNFASIEELKELKADLRTFREAVDERSIAGEARYAKLEQEYLELLRVLSKTKKL